MNNTIKYIIIVALAAGGYLFYTKQQEAAAKKRAELEELERRYSNQNPPSGSNDWYRWISVIISIFGTVSSLWEIGGPFYNSGIPDPRKDPVGWGKILAQTNFLP